MFILDTKGVSFPGERTIAILSGRTDKTARIGIKRLEGFPGVSIYPYTARSGKRSKKFHIKKPPNEKGRAFPFYKQIIEGGHWSELTPSAQALYPVMRYFGFWNYECFEDLENPESFEDDYKDREYDLCEESFNSLARYSNIDVGHIPEVLQNLINNDLIDFIGVNEETGLKRLKVYLKPPQYFKRSYLNAKIIKRYSKSLG